MGRHTRRQITDLSASETQRLRAAWVENTENEQKLLARFSLSHLALVFMKQAWGTRPKNKDYTRPTD
jgi:hypothetical protein